MKEFEQIKAVIEEKQIAVDSEIDHLKNIIENSGKDAELFRAKADEALKKKNVAACQEALKTMREKQDLEAITEAYLLELKEQPWLSKQEYQELKGVLFAGMDKKIESAILDAGKHTEALKEILHDINTAYSEADELLKILQRDGLKKENPHDIPILYEKYRSSYNLQQNLSWLIDSGACIELSGYYDQIRQKA